MAPKHEWAINSYFQSPAFARVGVDVISAAATAFIISPVVTLIDSTIMMKAAGKDSFSTCLGTLVRSFSKAPHKLFISRPSRLVFAVYFGTYLSANVFDTATSTMNDLPPATATATTSKFAGTAVVATALTVYKDSRLAQIFGGQGRTSAVPLASYCLFTFRDAITIFASFNMPTLIAPKLANMVEGEARRLKVAQFLLPAAIQFITTPVHLLGLDLHNRKGWLGFRPRADRVLRDMRTAIPARIIRIMPAFGIGGVANLSMRTSMMNSLAARQQGII